MKQPNLFNLATSELSQDAFLSWLLMWANKDYKLSNDKLHKCAVEFVQNLLQKDIDFKINTIEVGKQKNHIDVWAKINDEYFILIEDKKATKEHSNQLNRYAKFMKNELTEEKLVLVYFKMEEQGNYDKVQEAGYEIFSRNQMLSIISKYKGVNSILDDYIDYLEELDEKINSFKKLPLNDWHWYSWKGFYNKLQNELKGNWDYVSNPSGGFLGYWWHWKYITINNNNFELYLQLEQDKLIVKIKNPNKETRKDIREIVRKNLFQLESENNISFSKYGRVGMWMGIAKLNEEYRKTDVTGLINLEKTFQYLKNIEQLIDNLIKKLDKEYNL